MNLIYTKLKYEDGIVTKKQEIPQKDICKVDTAEGAVHYRKRSL